MKCLGFHAKENKDLTSHSRRAFNSQRKNGVTKPSFYKKKTFQDNKNCYNTQIIKVLSKKIISVKKMECPDL